MHGSPGRPPITGPLSTSKSNPNYFVDPTGKAVYLTGTHTWSTIVDSGRTEVPAPFDFERFLDFLDQYGHNFTRLWAWEFSRTVIDQGAGYLYAQPQFWERTGPGLALDGKPKFNLEVPSKEYYSRLHERVAKACDRGIYVSVMLFEGWTHSFGKPPHCWDGHPFNPANNINDVNGDPTGTGRGFWVHTLENPLITRLQEAHVRRVVDTVNEFDNVLYEITNESRFDHSREWQYQMIRYLREYEASRPKQHPIGMTGYGPCDNSVLVRSPADWISPGLITRFGAYPDPFKDDPPVLSVGKVLILDTDHLWGIGGNRGWVWKSFLRGYNPINMDPYDGRFEATAEGKEKEGGPVLIDHTPWLDEVRINLGYTLAFAQRLDLIKMIPRGDLALGCYCLANPGDAYVVYSPSGREMAVDLTDADGPFRIEWFDPARGISLTAEQPVRGGRLRQFTPPFVGDAVLYLSAAR